MHGRVVGDRAHLARELARRFDAAASEATAARTRFAVALTGGSTTGLYESIARLPRDWGDVHFFFGDERAVPPDHADSNYALARRTLLDRIALPPANVHRMHAERDDLDAAARAYELELGSGPLDVVMLGVGPDGHVASLFPGHRLLGERDARVSWLDDSPKPPPRRVTLTIRALHEARALWLFAMGAEKASVVRRAVDEHDTSLPAALAASDASATAPAVTWFLDEAAASELG